jgi:septal ring factor EnvC (AmiA/AmiB activator)
MTGDQTKSIKDVEDELAQSKERAKALEKQIKEAEAKHPPPIDHPEDGGVI